MNEKVCVYCKKDPGADRQNKILWFGFLDKDTNQLVCMNCRKKHYDEKAKTKYRGLYTEFPVYRE